MAEKNGSCRYKLFMVKGISVIKIFTPWLRPLHAVLIYGLHNYIRYADDCLHAKHFGFFILLISFPTLSPAFQSEHQAWLEPPRGDRKTVLGNRSFACLTFPQMKSTFVGGGGGCFSTYPLVKSNFISDTVIQIMLLIISILCRWAKLSYNFL